MDDELERLRVRGLVRAEVLGADRHWYATAPDAAVELLLMARQNELAQARLILPKLREEHVRGAHQHRTDSLQIIPADPQSQLDAYLQIYRRATQEVAVLLCPPFGVSAPDEIEDARANARQRGVRFRIVMDPELLQWSGWLEAARGARASGDDIRLLAQLPFKMVLADRLAGLIPLAFGQAAGPAVLLETGAMLEGLHLVFEQLWRNASPLAQAGEDGSPGAAAEDEDLSILLTMLASGSNDKSIADALGISDRTLQRRIRAARERLGAHSRFHFGWLAARRADAAG